jgi:RHS repeat-associated protein
VEYWTYKYDLLNRLTEVRKNGTIVGEYGYDPEGLRVVKRAHGETIHYVFQGLEPIYTKNLTTGKVKSYVYAGTKLFARVDGVIGDTNAKKYWYHTDQVGSVKAVTNQAGAVVWNADYLPFGQQYMKNKLDSTFEEDDLGFTGKGYDSDVGLYYFNARWYDADTGRFISEDPVGDPSNPNLYSYGRNNPLSFNDPTGLESTNPGNVSTNTTGGNYGWNNGSGGTTPGENPGTGGPSWQIPGAMESKDKNGNPIWIWGNLDNGIFSTNTTMSDYDICSLLLENSFVNGVYCQTPGNLEGPGIYLRKIVLGPDGKSEIEIENGLLAKDRVELGLEQVNFRETFKHIYNTGLIDPISGLPILVITTGPNETSNFLENYIVWRNNQEIHTINYFAKQPFPMRYGVMPFGVVEGLNLSLGWKVGDPITNLTRTGKVPLWSTVRARFWKNEALLHPELYEEGNLARMQKGLAPQRINPNTGELESMELHHNPAQRDGGLFEFQKCWPDEHAAIDPYRNLGF